MKPYTKKYMSFFGYTTADFIPCECCGEKSVDIHHIIARSIARNLINHISNLMAVCRNCHEKYGDKKQHKEFLLEKHIKFMKDAKTQ